MRLYQRENIVRGVGHHDAPVDKEGMYLIRPLSQAQRKFCT